MVVEGRRRNIPDSSFHPQTIINSGGGNKGTTLPEDYREQTQRFFGSTRGNSCESYGFSEISGAFPGNFSTNGFCIPPWFIPMILDKNGEELLNPKDSKGVVEGRMAIFDPLVEGRWGGVISGDNVTVDFSEGPDAVKVPRVLSIARYKDLAAGDDKLTCAGTIEAYVRGLVEA